MFKSILTAALLSIFACATQAQEVTLRVHTLFPPNGAAVAKGLKPFCEKIATDSNNRLKCQIFPAMQLGGTPQDLYSQAEGGFVDIAFFIPGYNAGRFPITDVFDLPFMFGSAQQGAQAAWDLYEKHGKKEWGAVKPLAFSPSDLPHFHLKDKPINSASDLKGMKIRAASRMSSRMLSVLGAVPVPMPATQVGEALSKGVVEGTLFPWEGVPPFKIHEMVKYHSVTGPDSNGLYNAITALVMNKDKYESLPADLKAVIDQNSGLALSRHLGNVWDAAAIEGQKVAQAKGNTINVIPKEELDRWAEISEPLYSEWTETLNKNNLPATVILQDARDLITKYK